MIEPIPIATIRNGDHLEITADEAQCTAIAKRLGLPGVDRFEAGVSLSREGQRIEASGRVRAKVVQSCIATGEPVPACIDEAFNLLFLPEPDVDSEEEIELGEKDLDVIFHDGATIRLGDALADTLALALDPYPRSAGAEEHLKDAGVLSEEEASPFGVLSDLKKKLEGG